MPVPDYIERIEMLPFSRERVWDAITKPEQLSQWFDIVKDFDFRVGGTINFLWENELSPYTAVIEKIEPLHCFAFRWASHALGHPHLRLPPTATTLVTFTLEEVAQGTRLTLVESGFASLPEAFQVQSHEDNLGGWQSELPKLRVYLQSTISEL